MKRFVFLFMVLLCLVPVTVRAAVANLTLGADDVLRGSFVQERYMKGFDKPLKSEGAFVVSSSHGLIWNMVKPFASVTVITSSGLVQKANGEKTVDLSAQKLPFVSQLYEMIGGVLMGKWSALQQKFMVTQTGSTQSWQMSLVPIKQNDPMMPFKEIVVKGGRFVHEVDMIKPDDDKDILFFEKVSVTRSALTKDELAAYGEISP